MWRGLIEWWDRAEDARVLRGLDDRMLEDMGVPRGEIARRVRGEAEGGGARSGRLRMGGGGLPGGAGRHQPGRTQPGRP